MRHTIDDKQQRKKKKDRRERVAYRQTQKYNENQKSIKPEMVENGVFRFCFNKNFPIVNESRVNGKWLKQKAKYAYTIVAQIGKNIRLF